MNFCIVSLLGLALIAGCIALPIDFGVGVDLKLGDVDYWKKEITLGNQKVQLGMGWNATSGVVSGAAKLTADVNGQQVPITAAVSSNVQDVTQLKYQVGSILPNKFSGIVYGEGSGAVQYQFTGRMPSSGEGSPIIAASLEGSGLKSNTVTGGVAVGDQIINAKVQLDEMKPSNFNIGVGSNAL